MRRVLVTGATGFLGEHVLIGKPPHGVSLEAFVRESSDLSRLLPDVRTHRGDLADPASLSRALDGVDVLLNLASLGFGHAPAIIEACHRARVPRAVFISTTSIYTRLPAKTKPVRLEAERLLRESGLPATVLRPTMIYGTPRDRNIWRLIRFLRLSPAVPLVDGGRHQQQPVHVQDVAAAVWKVLDYPATLGGAFNIAGARALTLAEMAATICRLLGKACRIVPVPVDIARTAAAVARRVPLLPKISDEQILRLEEDKVFDNAPARAAFGFEPMDFAAGVAREISWPSR